MAESNIQGPSGPHHASNASITPFEGADGELREGEDPGIVSAPGTAPALEDEPVE
jgi:hypothetical protein